MISQARLETESPRRSRAPPRPTRPIATGQAGSAGRGRRARARASVTSPATAWPCARACVRLPVFAGMQLALSPGRAGPSPMPMSWGHVRRCGQAERGRWTRQAPPTAAMPSCFVRAGARGPMCVRSPSTQPFLRRAPSSSPTHTPHSGLLPAGPTGSHACFLLFQSAAAACSPCSRRQSPPYQIEQPCLFLFSGMERVCNDRLLLACEV